MINELKLVTVSQRKVWLQLHHQDAAISRNWCCVSSVPLGAPQKRYVKVANSGDHTRLPKHGHGGPCASRQMRLYHVAALLHVSESRRVAEEVSEDVLQARSLKSVVGLRSRAEPQALSQTNA